MVDQTFYLGREQALVKHTFLERYFRNALPKFSQFPTFVYVDLFAGPWGSKCSNYSDTSFGIALREMAKAKAVQRKLGREVKMIAHLVEKENHEELREAVEGFKGVDKIYCHAGEAEDFAKQIAKSIPTRSFRFVNIDPKGLPDVREFRELIAPQRTEVMLNFMFEFANRFAHTDRLPKLEAWLSELSDDPDWQSNLSQKEKRDREDYITLLASHALAKIGNYDYSPAISVDEVDADRCLYKLIYLSRHPLGLKIFRDSEHEALSVQATARSDRKRRVREEKSGQGDLFSGDGKADPGERSARKLASERSHALRYSLELLARAGAGGCLWDNLWPRVLERHLIKHAELAREVGLWQKAGAVEVEGWAANRRSARDGDLIRLTHLP